MTAIVQKSPRSPSGAQLIAQATALGPLLRAHASDGEINRRQSREVIAGLTCAGMFRLHKPAKFAGCATNLRTVLTILERLGAADGSTSWLVGLAATGSWMVAHSSLRAQEEIFGSDPDARIASSLHRSAPARRVDGGLLVSGRWAYASGSQHATWACLAAVDDNDTAQSATQYVCLVPSCELRLIETWNVVGMRGTGSNTWEGDRLFVPDHRLIRMQSVGEPPGTAVEARYRLPFMAVAALGLIGPILGIGQAALSAVIADAPRKPMQHSVFDRQSDSVGVQVQVAQAALAMQTARLHIYDTADTLDRAAAEGRSLTYDDRAQFRGAAGYAAQQVLNAIQMLIDVHGAGTFAESNPLQRYWRDANIAARHAGLNAMLGYEVLGKSLLGVEERISPVV
jgi:3-hydroxy-9,10-secoandrosta-1,3,5(10)-triene-9,17-dione monooxygenase